MIKLSIDRYVYKDLLTQILNTNYFSQTFVNRTAHSKATQTMIPSFILQ